MSSVYHRLHDTIQKIHRGIRRARESACMELAISTQRKTTMFLTLYNHLPFQLRPIKLIFAGK
jgi:hypothetical protein